MCVPAIDLNDLFSVRVSRGALLSLTPGGLGSALSPALMSNSTLATIQGVYRRPDNILNS